MYDPRKIVDGFLRESMPPKLKDAVDSALANGATKQEILRRVRQQAGGRRGVALQVEAYLEAGQDGK